MASLYDDHYAVLKDILYRSDVPVLSIPDPAGVRVGNGGAIGNTLLVLQDKLAELAKQYPHLATPSESWQTQRRERCPPPSPPAQNPKPLRP